VSPESTILIGVDGGATKVSVWRVIADSADRPTFRLGEEHGEHAYAEMKGFSDTFTPVNIQQQLADRDAGAIRPGDDESAQGSAWVEAAARAVAEVSESAGGGRVLIGIGLPGLKTPDKRGLAVVANGPRIPDYCDRLESQLKERGVEMQAPIRELGSDADYCGMGEEYAAEGSFRPVRDAYYLGGGTGVADAMKLGGRLVPFDEAKPWIAKTWEICDEERTSFERSISARGVQALYARYSGMDESELDRQQVYLAEIARRSIDGEPAARRTVELAGARLAAVIADRIETVYGGDSGRTQFVNEAHPALEPDHPWRGTVLERVVLGQRLAQAWADPASGAAYRDAVLPLLARRLLGSERLDDAARDLLLEEDGTMQGGRIVASLLREAPALGAAAAAWLSTR
jgi:hypothetical protein